MSDKPSIADFVATDDSGGFVNLKTGEVLDAGAMHIFGARICRSRTPRGLGVEEASGTVGRRREAA
jgi:hypothetical protein